MLINVIFESDPINLAVKSISIQRKPFSSKAIFSIIPSIKYLFNEFQGILLYPMNRYSRLNLSDDLHNNKGEYFKFTSNRLATPDK